MASEENGKCHLKKCIKVLSPCLPFWRDKRNISRSASVRSHPRASLLSEFKCQSTILDPSQIQSIEEILPSTAMALAWKLSYSTLLDGYSLNSLYRQLCKFDSPALLVIEDTEKNIFGAFSSSKLEQSTTFYGTNNCFLFKCQPAFQYYKATEANHFYVMGTLDALIFGSDDGAAGLWIDSDLYRGRSERCKSFSNPPLVPEKNFIIRSLECWTFDKCY